MENQRNEGMSFDFLKLRKQYRLTQAKLADLLKVSKNYICQIETGRKVPSESLVELVQRIEKELAANPPSDFRKDLGGAHTLEENPAVAYARELWAAAKGDKNLEGYVVTKMKMCLPLDKPPFSGSPSEPADNE